jgi:hypothetical protein
LSQARAARTAAMPLSTAAIHAGSQMKQGGNGREHVQHCLVFRVVGDVSLALG